MGSMKCTLLLCRKCNKKTADSLRNRLMAGAEGLEPSTKVLETHVLPLHHAPMFSRTGFIIQEIRSFVNTQVSILRLLFASWGRTHVMAWATPVRENCAILTAAHVFSHNLKPVQLCDGARRGIMQSAGPLWILHQED